MKNRSVKKTVAIGICVFLCIVIVLIVLSSVKPIFPGKDVEILYPGNYALVPRDFAVYCVATRWYFGLETTPRLFLAPEESHVRMHSPFAVISVDGTRYAVSTEGNHHIIWMSLPYGDHIIRLEAAGEKRELHVRVTREPDVYYRSLDSVHDVVETTDRLKSALFEYLQSVPQGEKRRYTFQRIFFTEGGAFIAYCDSRNQVLNGCEITYLDLFGGAPGADEIAAAPTVFTWAEGEAELPVIDGALETGGDRLYLVLLDDVNLTVYSVFPDGKVTTELFPLEDVLGELSGAIAESPLTEITTHGLGEFLHVYFTVSLPDGRPEEVNLLISGSTIQKIDLSGYCVEGVNPNGRLIACYPAPAAGPCTTLLFDETGPDETYFPLPHVEDFLSFTGGSVFDRNRFYPEYPRFEIAPAVPQTGDTGVYDPTYFVTAGDVTFPPDVLRVSIGGIEGYYRMSAVERYGE